MSRLSALLLLISTVTAWDVARTPPMGWNSWNYWGCGVNATILMAMADAIASTPLKEAGYIHVSSDDCWMGVNRSASGNQVANPAKFPDGFAAVATYIHSLGLKAGLYSAKGPKTCAGFAASCQHEVQDAAQWASWGIDLVKDDSCSSCGSESDDELYGNMWSAIQASGRAMVLMVEGAPSYANLTRGGLGNAHRVGHDISPLFNSMLSLVDIGAGLWMYAHNSSNPLYGGFFNDLDMIEVGNAPDFVCGADAAALARCQTHFTMWTLMKAPLILGSDLTAMDSATLSVLTNADAIAVNQDALAVQARRRAVAPPANATLGASFIDNIAVVARCDAARPTQAWRWTNLSHSVRDELYLVPCAAAADAYQRWQFVPAAAAAAAGAAGAAATQLQNVGAGLCVDAGAQFDPGLVTACTGAPAQQWARDAASGHVATASGRCLDVYQFAGPDVEIGSCKQPGSNDANQIWSLGGDGSLSPLSAPGMCLSVTAGVAGGTLSTVDPASGRTYCLTNYGGAEGTWGGGPCSGGGAGVFQPALVGGGVSGVLNYTLAGARGGGPQVNNQVGASGPVAHSRYISGFSWSGAGSVWALDLAAAQAPGAGTRIAATDGGLLDDDLVGGVTRGGDFCLDLVTGGGLESWTAPLAGGRWAAALLNRSPARDTLTLDWASINATAGARFAVRDVWQGADVGTFAGSYTAAVEAHAAAYLILTPA